MFSVKNSASGFSLKGWRRAGDRLACRQALGKSDAASELPSLFSSNPSAIRRFFACLCTPRSLARLSHSSPPLPARFRIFFRENCFVCSCKFGVSVGGSEFRGLLCYCCKPELGVHFFEWTGGSEGF